VAVNVTLSPVVIVDAETTNESMVGPTEVGENVMAVDIACPCTAIVPKAGFDVYPVTEPTVNETVPFGSENTIVLAVDVLVFPANATDHEVPGGSPASANVTSYSGGGATVNVIDVLTPAPFTVTDPDGGEAM